MKTRWEKIIDHKYYTEGPGVDSDGNIYFTTLKGGSIMRLDINNTLCQWSSLSCPNGQRILANGHHLVCEVNMQAITEVDRYGDFVRTIVQGTCAGIPFTTPNDLIVDQFGGCYFTNSVRYNGQVFYVDPKGNEYQVLSGLDFPNGIAISPDGTNLLIAESYTNRILTVGLASPGMAKGKYEVFADLPQNPLPLDHNRAPYTANLPDGIAFDHVGRLWVAHYGMGALQVLDVNGVHLHSVPTGIPATSNLCFSKNNDTIYVTGGSAEPGPGMLHKITIL